MYKIKNTATFISTAELAKRLGVSRIAVFKMIKKGKVPAERIGRSFAVAAKDVPAIIRARREGKRERG